MTKAGDKNSTQNGSTRAASELSRAKRTVFYTILIALPFLLFFLLEIILSLTHYGGDLDLFVKQGDGRGTYVLNPNVTARYFFQKGVKTPIPITQTFSAQKESHTFRIFCLGASTTQGFPYQVNVAFPAVLKNILTSLHPDKNFEVINCGITALTSHSVYDMGREILKKYEPDLLIVYSGHNEFYGVFGQASRLALFKSRRMTTLFLRLQRSRTILLLRNFINSISPARLEKSPDGRTETLMGQMVKNNRIRYNSTLFRQAEEHYQANMSELVQRAQHHNTPILLCTLVDNQRDFPPFASLHSEKLMPADSSQWLTHVTQAAAFKKAGDVRAAVDSYNKALQIDSTHAKVHFEIALCYDSLRFYDRAKTHYQLAKDYDVVRFRAPSSFNTILASIAREHNIPLVDTRGALEQLSDAGIIGNNFVHEHVHPNQRGYFYIAKTIAQSMSDHKILQKEWDWSKSLPDSVYMAMSRLTLLDYEVVNYSIFQLTSHWPFPSAQEERTYEPVGNDHTLKIAKALIDNGEGNLVQHHLDYGFTFHQNNEFDRAEAEYLAAHAIQPLAETYNRLGRLYLRQTEIAYRDRHDYQLASQSYQKGVRYLKKGLEQWPDDIELNFNLGLLYFMRNDRTAEALGRFTKVLKLDPHHKRAIQQAGELYIRRSQPDSAKMLLQKGIELFPEETRFYTNLGLIYMQENKLDEAEKWLSTAVEKGNDLKAKYYLRQVRVKQKEQQTP